MQPVPERGIGTLYVTGPHLAREYLRDTPLTNAHFVSDPFDAANPYPMFRTGDLARRRDSGEIELLGRMDQQVKIRGFRINLAEVETCLRGHAQVEDAVISVQHLGAVLDERKSDGSSVWPSAPAHHQGGNIQTNSNDAVLVAYVIPRAGVTAKQLRDFLKASLPPYMVPAKFMFLREFPLTLTGKADRLALPPASLSRAESDVETLQNATQQALVEICSHLLACERIGIEDNFIEWGAESLFFSQLSLAIFERFGLEIPLTVLFDRATIAELAAEISINE